MFAFFGSESTKRGENRLSFAITARFQLNMAALRLVLGVTFIEKKAIKEMCEKSMWHGRFLGLAAFFRAYFFFEKPNKIIFLDSVRGKLYTKFHVCVVFALVRRSRIKQTHTQGYKSKTHSAFVTWILTILMAFLSTSWMFHTQPRPTSHSSIDFEKWLAFFENRTKFCL